MESISTPRLILSPLKAAEPGSEELEWIHELRSNEQSAFWNLGGPAKTLSQTQDVLKHILPERGTSDVTKTYRIPYMVHEIMPAKSDDQDSSARSPSTRFIGLITLRSLAPAECEHAPRLGFNSTSTMLSLEIAYMFLPFAWGRGYATEAITAIFKSCQRAGDLWAPYEKLCIRAIVNGANKPSQRVMEKCGMGEPEHVVVENFKVFVAGEWQVRHELAVYGRELGLIVA